MIISTTILIINSIWAHWKIIMLHESFHSLFSPSMSLHELQKQEAHDICPEEDKAIQIEVYLLLFFQLFPLHNQLLSDGISLLVNFSQSLCFFSGCAAFFVAGVDALLLWLVLIGTITAIWKRLEDKIKNSESSSGLNYFTWRFDKRKVGRFQFSGDSKRQTKGF